MSEHRSPFLAFFTGVDSKTWKSRNSLKTSPNHRPASRSQGGSLPAKVKKQAVNGAVAPVAGTSLPLTLVRALLPLLILAFAIYYALR